MELKGRDVLVLGGAGLVGVATCRMLFSEKVNSIIISSLTELEVQSTKDLLEKEFPGADTKIYSESGNIFVRDEFKYLSRIELFSNDRIRHQVVGDVIDPFDQDILDHSTLNQIFKKHRPDIVIDCINSATAFAYQDIFTISQRVRTILEDFEKDGEGADRLHQQVETLLGTQYLPQLIRHIQILLAASKMAGTSMYLKVGTSGTGGMGLNIPYTHSEDKPSRMLLSKSAIAGAHTMLLFLMARTPDAPIIKEVKPTAAIAWKRIEHGPVSFKGSTRYLEDCLPDNPYPLKDIVEKQQGTPNYLLENGEKVLYEAPFIDTGENGMFALGEFETLTDTGQMEFITPEEIAQSLIWEIKGRNSGFDVIDSLDHTTMGPTYRAGFLRRSAIQTLRSLEKSHGVPSVAFELLGPPRTSKLLWEAHLFREVYRTMEKITQLEPAAISADLFAFLSEHPKVRSAMLTIGIPILLPDGINLWRGSMILIPAIGPSGQGKKVSGENIEQWAHDGWVDLRVKNADRWKKRFGSILAEIAALDPNDTSSSIAKNRLYWFEDGIDEINIGKTVSWIHVNEEAGERMKT